jgi:thiol-disulfide isomerase/thioredoxin
MNPGRSVTLALLTAALLGAICAIALTRPAAAAPPSGYSPAAAAATPSGYNDAVGALWNRSLPDTHGASQPLAQYRGRIVVLNFWASWCGPCVKEMPALSDLQRRYAQKGVQFVGIGIDSAPNVTHFLEKVKVDYPIYVAGFGGADIARQFGNTTGGLPFTVVIDKTGRVRYTKLGEIDAATLSAQLNLL